MYIKVGELEKEEVKECVAEKWLAGKDADYFLFSLFFCTYENLSYVNQEFLLRVGA